MPALPHVQMRPGRAFTLVELLVVIAIIGVLIAILLPVISKAQAASRFVKCSSNLRQQVLAITTYAVNHRDYKPPLWLTSPVNYYDWISPNTRRYQSSVGLGILVDLKMLTYDTLLDPSEGMSEDVEIDRGKWFDPAKPDSGSSYAYRWRDRPWPRTTSIITSAMRRDLMRGATMAGARRLKQNAIVMDLNAETGHGYSGEYAGRAWVSHGKSQRVNVGYVDGHVASFPIADVQLKYPAAEFDELDWFLVADTKAR